MKIRFALLLFAAMLSGAARVSAQKSVDARGISSTMKLEDVIYGHLRELNGKFKLRATEVTFAPGGIGMHYPLLPQRLGD